MSLTTIASLRGNMEELRKSPLDSPCLSDLPLHVLDSVFVFLDNPADLSVTCKKLRFVSTCTSTRLRWWLARPLRIASAFGTLSEWLKNDVAPDAKGLRMMLMVDGGYELGPAVSWESLRDRARPDPPRFFGSALFDQPFTSAVIDRIHPPAISATGKDTPNTRAASLSRLSISSAPPITAHEDAILASSLARCLLFGTSALVACFRGYTDVLERAIRKSDSAWSCLFGYMEDYFRTSLHLAIAKDDANLVAGLLRLLSAQVKEEGWEEWWTWTCADDGGFGPLHLAAMLNTPELARLLVEAGALEDLHLATSTENLSPVHVAAAVDAVEVVDFLLSAGINVNITHQGNTPLHVAARHGRLKTANLLIKRGADLLARVDSLTPLHIAAHKGHLEMVRLLCENGAEVDALDSQGTTPLFRSLEGTARRLEVAHALVTEFGASIDLRDNEDWTAAHYCARWGYSDLLQLILSRGFNPNAQDVDGWSLLHCAAKGGHAGIVVALLQKGARPDVCDAEDWNALHFACDTSEECVDVVKMLLDCGVDINAQSKVGLTALHLAARWGFLEATKLLLDHGSNPCAVEQGYRTPLHMATKGGHHDVAQKLIMAAPNPRELVLAKDIHGSTALHFISFVHTELPAIELLDLLHSYSADLSQPDPAANNSPLLHRVLRDHRPKLARALLEIGADPDVVDGDGNTAVLVAARDGAGLLPVSLIDAIIKTSKQLQRKATGTQQNVFHVAVAFGNFSIVERIIALADPVDVAGLIGAHDAAGRYPLHMCALHGATTIARMLLRIGADTEARDTAGRMPRDLDQEFAEFLDMYSHTSYEERGLIDTP